MLSGRVGGCPHSFDRDLDRVDRGGSRIVVLDRATSRPRLGDEPYGLRDASRVIGEAGSASTLTGTSTAAATAST